MAYRRRTVAGCLRSGGALPAAAVRKGAIELAAFVGWDNDVWASLIMPFAGLARLGSDVAMFLVLRPAIPMLAALPRRSARSVDVFANIIVPFFAIYLAWKVFAEDWLDFKTAALDYRVDEAMTAALTTNQVGDLHPDQLPVSTATWVIIFSALVLRYVLGRFKESLPSWMLAVRVSFHSSTSLARSMVRLYSPSLNSSPGLNGMTCLSTVSRPPSAAVTTTTKRPGIRCRNPLVRVAGTGGWPSV